MSIQNAINLLKDIDNNSDIRKELVLTPSEELNTRLEQLGYQFTDEEFEECINLMHVKCQHEEEANHLFQLVNWFKMLKSIN